MKEPLLPLILHRPACRALTPVEADHSVAIADSEMASVPA